VEIKLFVTHKIRDYINMKEAIKSLYSKIEFRSSEDNGKRIIEAVIPFNSKSVDLGGFREIITDTAFKRSLNEGKNIFAYYNHDDNKILGSTHSKTLELRSENDGLYCKLALGNSSHAQDCWDIISRGDCNTLSFAFIPYEVENRGNLRYLKSVNLKEVSFCVSQPAYEQTNSIAYTRKYKENKNMKNSSLITRSINLEKLEELFSSDSLITDIETVKEILAFIDPEIIKKVLQVNDPAEGTIDSKTEEKENKEDKEKEVISENEKQEITKLINEELQKKIEVEDQEKKE
jgi:HK97 family phage prohead protease